MISAAIVGCGQIARAHVQAIEGAGGHVIAVVDTDDRRARDLSPLAGGATPYTDLQAMLERERPDVVHVLTPPQTHAEVAITAMRAGSHALVEKPFALTLEECDAMARAADEAGVHVVPSHNYLFKPSVARARRLLESGALGELVAVDSFYGVSGERSSYAGAGAGAHWAWRLPGGVFTNFLPHLLYLQRHFLGGIEAIDGVGVVQPGPGRASATELTASVRGPGALGSMTVSLRARPYAKYLEIRGTDATVHADLVRELCVVRRDRLPGSAGKVTLAVEDALRTLGGTASSSAKVLTGRWGSMPGLRVLVRDLYEAMDRGGPPPVTVADGRAVVDALVRIREMLPPAAEAPSRRRRARHGDAKRVLVTGATGFLGRHAATELARCGWDVAVLARDPARVPFEVEAAAEVVRGDLRDPDSVTHAVKDADAVVHCAALTSNAAPREDLWVDNVVATSSILHAAHDAGVAHFVHASSVVVYGLDLPPGATVDERSPYGAEDDPWAPYQASKIASDRLVLEFGDQHGLPVTVLRFGVLHGPGRPPAAGVVAAGPLQLAIGRGHNRLPYVAVTHAAEAVALAVGRGPAAAGAFNVVDEPQVAARAHRPPGARGLVVPPAVLATAARWLEWRAGTAGAASPPRLTRHIVRGATRDIVYDTGRAAAQLGWAPR